MAVTWGCSQLLPSDPFTSALTRWQPSSPRSVYQCLIAAVTNYHEFSGLKHTMAQLVPLIWALLGAGRAMILSGGSREGADPKLLPVVSRTGLPCGCGTEVPISLLALIWGLLSAPRGLSLVLGLDPLSQNQQWHIEGFDAENSTCFSSASSF